MKKILLFAAACCIGIGFADAAVRDASSINRQQTDTTASATVSARAQSVGATQQNSASTGKTANTSSGNTTSRNSGNTVSRTTTARSGAIQSTTARSATSSSSSARGDKTTTSRSAAQRNVVRSATTARKTVTPTTAARSARSTNTARATSNLITTPSNTFGTGYNACRDAYFTCMDQFCANQNDTYRRCVCSSRLTEIQSRERALSQSADQIQDFKDLNIEVIPKTAAEVNAMMTASEGETIAATIQDTSASAQALTGISEVLANTKSKSLSTLGTLDIAGDINAIWATTDLASGANIANLTGEALYNAVHAQCVELIAGNCSSTATLNMVVSAYGMYIENDCTTLLNALDKKLTAANSTIRDTEREMYQARLENYNAHNSTSINDCIAQVRKDITADTACGEDYVHCLDLTGKYLNRETGEPIYTAELYQLENQISLDGDILTNPTNRMIVADLNRKREYAKRGLETCRDLADDVWEEFMRQAITEIYQGQQERIRQAKTDCLDVVNVCYDEQSKSLKDFSNVKEQLLLGSRLELSEELCQERLQSCSNLYGGADGNGLELLLTAMHNITDQKIAKECLATLKDFAKDMCSVPSNDSLHSYPYGCRVYAPGEQQYAGIAQCNQDLWGGSSGSGGSSSGGGTGDGGSTTKGYVCPTYKKYTSCNKGYYLSYTDASGKEVIGATAVQVGNSCKPCPSDCGSCAGGTAEPQNCTSNVTDEVYCGEDYIGSLYQKVVRYAMQACVRPSEASLDLPTTVLEDVNVVMDSIRVDMAKVLSAECERLGGIWVDTQWIDDVTNAPATRADDIHDKTGHQLHKYFYQETGANTKWGYCAAPEDSTTDTTDDTDQTTGSS